MDCYCKWCTQARILTSVKDAEAEDMSNALYTLIDTVLEILREKCEEL